MNCTIHVAKQRSYSATLFSQMQNAGFLMTGLIYYESSMSPVVKKSVFRVLDQVQHKLGCTATEASNLGSRRIVLCSEIKGADQLHDCKIQVFFLKTWLVYC